GGTKAPVATGPEAPQLERPERDSLEREHRMTDCCAHPLDLSLAALVDREQELVGAPPADGRGCRQSVVELDAVAKRSQPRLAHRTATQLRPICPRDLERGMREAICELSVVCQQDQARGVGIETPHRV